MKRLLYTLLACLPLLGHAQKHFNDTSFYINHYEVIESRFKVPLLGSPQFIGDTSYKVYMRDAVRVVIKNKICSVGQFGKYTILSTDVKVRLEGSNGIEYWVTYYFKGGEQAVLFGDVFMLDVEPSKKVNRSYTFDIVKRPGRIL